MYCASVSLVFSCAPKWCPHKGQNDGASAQERTKDCRHCAQVIDEECEVMLQIFVLPIVSKVVLLPSKHCGRCNLKPVLHQNKCLTSIRMKPPFDKIGRRIPLHPFRARCNGIRNELTEFRRDSRLCKRLRGHRMANRPKLEFLFPFRKFLQKTKYSDRDLVFGAKDR